MASQITGVSIVYSIVCSGTDQRNIKALREWPLCGEFTGEFPAQRAFHAEMFFVTSLDDVIMK